MGDFELKDHQKKGWQKNGGIPMDTNNNTLIKINLKGGLY